MSAIVIIIIVVVVIIVALSGVIHPCCRHKPCEA